MKAIILKNVLPSTNELLALALEEAHRFTPVTNRSNTLGALPTPYAGFKARSIRGQRLSEIMQPVFSSLKDQREEIKENLHLRKLDFFKTKTFLSVMKDGDYIEPHRDVSVFSPENLQMMVLLYACTSPKRFSGGELVIHWRDRKEIIEVEDNTAIILPGRVKHSVNKVVSASNKFEDSRFVVVGRVLGKPSVFQRSSYILSRLRTASFTEIKAALSRRLQAL